LKYLVKKFKALFGRAGHKDAIIGIEFAAQSVSFAYMRFVAGQPPLLKYCDHLLVASGENPVELVRSRLIKLGLQSVPCHLVMATGQYQLILGEAPKVPIEELAEALRWRVKDLVQIPIADAVVEAFLLPEDSARGANRMAYAVVCEKRQVERLVGYAKALQLNLDAIDISELSLRNLAQSCCDTKRGVALVRLTQGTGSLQIIRNGELYLARQFSLPYNAGLLDDLPSEALILELQRSLDYFERQMRQVPPSHIYLCGENVTADKLTPEIRNALAVSINLLDLTQGITIDASIDEHNLSLCLPALGVALRQEQLELA
jgi:MSHA biogenesis protein MshI